MLPLDPKIDRDNHYEHVKLLQILISDVKRTTYMFKNISREL